jgi:hypothetical protein
MVSRISTREGTGFEIRIKFMPDPTGSLVPGKQLPAPYMFPALKCSNVGEPVIVKVGYVDRGNPADLRIWYDDPEILSGTFQG